MRPTTHPATIVSWVCRLVAAGVLLQTLYFKFTAAPESVYIFSKLGLEPWGRIGSGVAELVAAVMLIAPPTAAVGAIMSLGVITGAIASHLLVLGVVVRDDGGLLFALALTVFVCSAIALVLERRALAPLVRALRRPARHIGGSSRLPATR
ncbi:MAG TPA: DoxX family protein [Candidatus Binatia bacterium]|nr:DoxX family protein [Candidatus Binatia bacterium]